MSFPRRYGAALAATFALALVALAACSVGPAVQPLNQTGDSNFVTPDAAQLTPTPTFPPFTVGAWVSNYSPNPIDNITIYVLCRVQDTTMQGPPTPPTTPLGITVSLSGEDGSPVNATLQGTTGADGIAAIPYAVNDPAVGKPVDIQVSVNYQNATYIARTFFTPGVTLTPTPSGTPSLTPTP